MNGSFSDRPSRLHSCAPGTRHTDNSIDDLPAMLRSSLLLRGVFVRSIMHLFLVVVVGFASCSEGSPVSPVTGGGGQDSGGQDSGGQDSGGQDSGGQDSGGQDSGGQDSAVPLSYDVVVVGAGTGGIAAALQAARLGASVALVEETDWIGGQLAAGVTAIDDRAREMETGIYLELLTRIREHYQNNTPHAPKSINTCRFEGQYCPSMEPKVARTVLTEMLQESGVQLLLATRVTAVQSQNLVVTGVSLEGGTEIDCRVLVDATEHGDIIPLTPARYRVGNSDSDEIDADACIQDLTYNAVIRKYPGAVPDALRIAQKPPGYDQMRSRFARYVTKDGFSSGWKQPWTWAHHNAYRGMPDSLNPDDYTNEQPDEITKTAINLANDYPGTVPIAAFPARLGVRYLEDRAYRRQVDCAAKLLTLNFLYYVQHELGEPQWSVANDEGYDTDYNVQANSCPNIPASLKPLEAHLPQIPYVRESRRIVPIKPLTGRDTYRGADRRTSENFPSAVARGSYFADLHSCRAEADLDLGDTPDLLEPQAGLFQVPFETLIPEAVDGLVAAEKNVGVSRVASGAIRLQVVTMHTGQAAGAIAALAVRNGIQPRQLKPIEVQSALVQAGSATSRYAYGDVGVSSPYWAAVQLASTYEIIVGSKTFNVNDPLTRGHAAVILARLFNLDTRSPPDTPTFSDVPPTHPAFPFVEAVVGAGLAAGCHNQPAMFCVDDEVTRAHVAVFLVRGLGLDPDAAPATPLFTDVPAAHWAFSYIQLMAAEGLLTACNDSGSKFCPSAPTTRGQMAVFVSRVLLRLRR